MHGALRARALLWHEGLLALLLALPLLAVPPGTAGGCSDDRPAAIRELADVLRDASGEWRENVALPTKDGFVDPVAALDGLAQQDRLRWTKHDDEKCGAMVATAAALVGGRDRFGALLAKLEAKAKPRFQDELARARARFETNRLTAGDLHRVSEILYNTYVGGKDGSTDGDISKMVRASGRKRIPTTAKSPRELVDAMKAGDAFPLNVYLEQPEFIGWHVVLVWKDAAGVARVYDSDKFKGPQVFAEDGDAFAKTYLDWVSPGEKIAAEWEPATLYR